MMSAGLSPKAVLSRITLPSGFDPSGLPVINKMPPELRALPFSWYSLLEPAVSAGEPRGHAAPRLTAAASAGPCAKQPVMRVIVDFDVCASTGSCMQVCPEVFEVRSDGYLYLLQEEPPDSLRDKVQQAVELCPTGAISIED